MQVVNKILISMNTAKLNHQSIQAFLGLQRTLEWAWALLKTKLEIIAQRVNHSQVIYININNIPKKS